MLVRNDRPERLGRKAGAVSNRAPRPQCALGSDHLILAYAEGDNVAMNVGFYYVPNAPGRLAGTDLSGRAVPMAGPGGLPVGVGRVRAGGRPSLVFAARRGARVAHSSSVEGRAAPDRGR